MKYLLVFEKLAEIVFGALLIWGRFIPFTLAALFPIIINIFLFHVFEDLTLLPLAIILLLLEGYLIYVYRKYYQHILEYKAKPYSK